MLTSLPLVTKPSSFYFRIAIVSPNCINFWLFLGNKILNFESHKITYSVANNEALSQQLNKHTILPIYL
jgi:hypothetical protein